MAEKRKSSRAMKIVAGVLSMLAFVCAGVWIYGMTQDETHTASGSIVINAKVADVFARQADVEGQPAWRSGLMAVHGYKTGDDGKAEWQEEWADGDTLNFRTLELEKDRRIKVKLDHPRGVFYGTWTFEFEPAEGGTRVTITEEGGIPNALIRGVHTLTASPGETLKKHLAELKAACEVK